MIYIFVYCRCGPPLWATVKFFLITFFAKNRVSSCSKLKRTLFRPQKWELFIMPKIAI